DQPDVLRHPRLPEAVRVQPRQGDEADVAGAQRGQGDRLERHAREGGIRRFPPARARSLGDHAAGLVLERTPEGGILLRLSPEERSLVLSLAAELRSLLDGAPGDPSLRRLFPPAYEDE